VAVNSATYNVRVVNISLGAPAIDSYENDPVCIAVRRLYHLGIVVVCAAGNDGKNALGQKVYGQIHSPGNEPSAITVGATNTFGTDSRADDAQKD
jgi:serine protease AprX